MSAKRAAVPSLETAVSVPASENSAPRKRDTSLDGLRGIACLMVVFHHCAVEFGYPPFLIYGFTGVHLFFVLSGYLLSQPFLRHLAEGNAFPDLKTYFTRRFLRIYPPYFVALMVFAVLRVVTHTNIPTLANLLAHVLLIFNYFNQTTFYSINPVFWSLAIEAQFYILLPLIALSFSRLVPKSGGGRAWSFVLFFLLVGILSRCLENQVLFPRVAGEVSLVRFRSVTSFLDLFSWGMMVALLEKHPMRLRFAKIEGIAALLGAALVLLLAGNRWMYYFLNTLHTGFYGDWLGSGEPLFTLLFSPMICCGFALIILANNIRQQGNFRLLTLSGLVWVGEISYSIYLYHIGVQQVLLHQIKYEHYFPNFNTMILVTSTTTLPVVLLVSYIFFWLVERPCLAWMRRVKGGTPAKANTLP